MSLEVSIKGQDRRHVIDIVLKQIEQRIAELSHYGRQYYGDERPKQLTDAKLPKKVQKALEALRALDEEHRKAAARVATAKRRVEDALGDIGQLDVAAVRGAGWKRFVVRETDAAMRNRIEGNAEMRREKVTRLRDLQSRLLVAAASDESLEPIIAEFRVLAGGMVVL